MYDERWMFWVKELPDYLEKEEIENEAQTQLNTLVNTIETPKQRVERIMKNLKSAFDKLEWHKTVKRDNFIQWCKHESGDFYSNLPDKRYRKALIRCDQYPNGVWIDIDRNSSNIPLSIWKKNKKGEIVSRKNLSQNWKPIYGWYNYTNVNNVSSYLLSKKNSDIWMESKDIVINANKKTLIWVKLHIFDSDEDFVHNMLHRLTIAWVGQDDDLMIMMAKLSAQTGFNGYGAENLIRYANSGLLKEAMYMPRHEEINHISCVIPDSQGIKYVQKIIKDQLWWVWSEFMQQLKQKNLLLYNQYVKFLTLSDKQLWELEAHIKSGNSWLIYQWTYTDRPQQTIKQYQLIKLGDLLSIDFTPHTKPNKR